VRGRFVVTLLLAVLTVGTPVDASAAEPRDAVQAGREAMHEVGSMPWYDPQSDQLRPIELPEEPELRQSSNWVWQQNTNPTSNSSWNWELFWELFQYFIWLVLAGTFIFIMYLWLSTVAQNRFALQRERMDAEEAAQHEADRIEQLPFQVKRPTTDLLGEARRHYQTGNYHEAIIYLFSYQLVQLDRYQKIQLSKGTTNRQYLHEIRQERSLRELMFQSMNAFEDAFFGHYALNRERFEACWSRLDEFDRLVREGSSHATISS
jgi:heme exporter protein D